MSNDVNFGANGCETGQGNRICGPLQLRFNSGTLSVRDNLVKGAGALNYDSKLIFEDNTFGGTYSTAQSTLLSNTGNVMNDAYARGITCPEGLPDTGEEE